MKFVLGLLCLGYLVMPNLGVFELIPDAIPIVGHLDELAVTFLMTNFFGLGLGKNNEKPNLSSQIMFVIAGGLALLYLMYPSLGTVEFLPDALPFAGNVDEVLASLVLTYIGNSVRPQKAKNEDIIEGELVKSDEVKMIEG